MIATMKRYAAYARIPLAATRIVRNPQELDVVLELSDFLNAGEGEEYALTHLKSHPHTAAALTERPELGYHNVDELLAMPGDTLGHAYGVFLQTNDITPAPLRVPPKLIDNDELLYINSHLRQTHDLWHVVTGFGTDVAGELGLQAFYASQGASRFPITILVVGLLNALIYEWNDRDRRMNEIVRGWTMGRRAQPLFGLDWEQRLTRPLVAVQQELQLFA